MWVRRILERMLAPKDALAPRNRWSEMAATHREVWQNGTVCAAVAALTHRDPRIEIDVESPVRVDPEPTWMYGCATADRRRSARTRSSTPRRRRAHQPERLHLTGQPGRCRRDERPRGRATGSRSRSRSNDFPLRLGATRYVLLAGGVGITAMIGMAGAAARAGADYRFVYAGRGAASWRTSTS